MRLLERKPSNGQPSISVHSWAGQPRSRAVPFPPSVSHVRLASPQQQPGAPPPPVHKNIVAGVPPVHSRHVLRKLPRQRARGPGHWGRLAGRCRGGGRGGRCVGRCRLAIGCAEAVGQHESAVGDGARLPAVEGGNVLVLVTACRAQGSQAAWLGHRARDDQRRWLMPIACQTVRRPAWERAQRLDCHAPRLGWRRRIDRAPQHGRRPASRPIT